jgi:3-deoxy-D-manno-octulosonic-acid transferase
VTGNLKFEQSVTETENAVTELLRARFDVTPNMPLIIAASTHEPEERYVLESLDGEIGHSCRLMIAPRHPERFDAVQKVLRSYPYSFARRTAPQSDDDKNAAVILLDSIGELRAAYPLAEIVFVGGSLVPHGGQSVLEPAAVGKAIVTGPYTHNFDAVVKEFLGHNAIRQIRPARDGIEITERLKEEFKILLNDQAKRAELGANAAAVMTRSDRGMVKATVDALRTLVDPK